MSNNSQTSTADQFGVATFIVTEPGVYQFISTKNQLYSETKSTIVTGSKSIDVNVNFVKLTLTTNENADITISDGVTTITGTGTGNADSFLLPNLGDWHVEASSNGIITKTDIHATEYRTYVRNITQSIYGAYWSGGSETTLTRTDDAVSFTNPDPYVADGDHPGYSLFDSIWPWSDMEIVEKDGNSLVEIPKYWYKITREGAAMTFQIANYAADGFSVSPAHQDRGDGVGERDVVYIGRYHCASDYKSKTGAMPLVSISRAAARTQIQNLGTGYYLNDYALFWTVRMLYLVEFADWDSQKVIGYGCGNNSSTSMMGYTDSMPYHTGTMSLNRTTYGASTQYRYIEGIWDNVTDWCDGIRFSGSAVYVYTNPSTYSDSSGGTSVGTRATSGNEIKSFFTPSVSNLDWAMYPNSVFSDSSYTTYITDSCYYTSNANVLCIGGCYNPSRNFGMFFLNGYYTYSTTQSTGGARIQYLPQNS